MAATAVKSFAVDNELWDRVTVHVHVLPHAARDLLVLNQRQKYIDKLQAVGGSDRLQHLRHEVPENVTLEVALWKEW